MQPNVGLTSSHSAHSERTNAMLWETKGERVSTTWTRSPASAALELLTWVPMSEFGHARYRVRSILRFGK